MTTTHRSTWRIRVEIGDLLFSPSSKLWIFLDPSGFFILSSFLSSMIITAWNMLHIEVRLPVLLCAVKTIEGDFQFCWTISHKENPNLVRILYMVCTLKYIYKQYNKLHEHWYTKISSLRCVRLKMHQTCIWNTGYMQSIAGPVHASAVWTDEKKKINNNNNTNCSYRIFIVCRSPVSPVFWARILLSYLFLPKQSLCTNFAVTGDIPLISPVLESTVPP